MKLSAQFGPRAAALLAALALAGCANYAGIAPKAAELSPAAIGPTATFDQWPRTDWWAQYGDATLNGLIDRALAQNLTIQLAQSRLARAQAAQEGVEAADYPQLGLGIDSTRQRFSKNSLYPPPLAGAMATNNNALLNASYELDFWGKNRAALQAALSQVQAARAEEQAARVLVAAGVARAYFNLARLVEQRDVAQAILQQRAQTLALVQQRVRAGVDTNVELRQAEGNLPITRGDIAALDEQIELSRHALAALIGAGPQATKDLTPRLAAVPVPALPSVLPAELLARRAEVQAAKARVQAAAGDIDSAKAQFYPNINLAAFAGFTSLGVSRWFESGSQTYGIGPALRLPIFDAGRLRANLKARTADYDAAVQSYNQAVLDAARDVADQVSSWQSLAVQSREQQSAQAAAEAAYELALQRYKAGLSNYLTVLTAENAVLAQRRAGTELKARALELSVNLNRALGGGYADTQAAASPVAAAASR